MGKPYAHPESLVSADWVQEHSKDPKVRIVESDEDLLLYDVGTSPVQSQHRLAGRRCRTRSFVIISTAKSFLSCVPPERHRQRHHRGLLWRQVELVGLLRFLGLHPVRPQALQGNERRTQALDRSGPAARHGAVPVPRDEIRGRRW